MSHRKYRSGHCTIVLVGMGTIHHQAEYYDERWSSFEFANLYGLERCLFILQAISDLQLERPRICDFGCGAGWLTGILSSFGPTVGVDLSPKAVEQARQLYPAAQFFCADGTQWNPEPESFDVVVSQEVLEHVEDKPAYLRVVRRALRPGGYLLHDNAEPGRAESDSRRRAPSYLGDPARRTSGGPEAVRRVTHRRRL